MRGTRKRRELHKAAGALMLAFGVVIWPRIVQADTGYEIVVPNRIMVIKEGSYQEGRQLHVRGMGEQNIHLFGGMYSPATKEPTIVNLKGADSFVDVYSGYHDGQNVDVLNNVINVGDGNSDWQIYDDSCKVENSHYSHLQIKDTSGTGLSMNIIAGHSESGEVSGNVINLNGGKLGNFVIVSESKDDIAGAETRLHDNTLNLNAPMDLVTAKIYGAALFHDSDRSRTPLMGTNNTLNAYVKNVTVGELAGFNTYNFYLPLGTESGETMMTVSGEKNTDIRSSTINGIVARTASLPFNATVNLLVNEHGVTDGAGTVYQGTHADSGLSTGDINSKMYRLAVQKDDAHHVVLKVVGLNRLHPSTKSVVQTKVPTLVNRGADFLSGDAAQSAEAAGAQVYTPFFAASHSNMRHITGSYVDMKGYSMVLGMSKKKETPSRRTLTAPVFEFGNGHYDAYLDGGTHGQGSSRYYGMGIVFRNTFKNGRYYEGSLRGGWLKVDYATNDYVYNGKRNHEAFHSSTYYAGVHFGLGREVDWKPRHKFTYYGKFYYTRTGAEDISLRNGQLYHTSCVNSERLRLGIRDTYEADDKNKLYFGLAWEHEFDGSAYAVYDGLRTDTPRLRGNSYMMELGWIIKPKGNDHMSFDLSATGWLGRQRGITGRLGINWMF
ncbi:MAG: autotransporter outer membrane beta-barrel domain-containing protein [Selenomonas sp.]|uniref:autotransporter outer membrane beta-barrel domain-containing protein n=1 Tax=Selenomonas sp. TaxID=2053611 RepID=UPI002600351E|nr:autotransporter outer membrane beta-barrel domain-containing protein [Selenomonas sp.]MCR5758008.1 autotransporter outer membrane beta-barrel domain-containing protein [Selenomonas sp.]